MREIDAGNSNIPLIDLRAMEAVKSRHPEYQELSTEEQKKLTRDGYGELFNLPLIMAGVFPIGGGLATQVNVPLGVSMVAMGLISFPVLFAIVVGEEADIVEARSRVGQENTLKNEAMELTISTPLTSRREEA